MEESISCVKLDKNFNDYNQIAEMVLKMAKDSENIDLNREIVLNGVKLILTNSETCFYYLYLLEDKTPIGTNIVHYQYDLISNKYYHWIGSLFVEKSARRRGIFSKDILPFNELQIKDSKLNMDKNVYLYMDIYNKSAENAYFKNGFKVNEDKLIFEEDSLLLKSDQKKDFAYLNNNYLLVTLNKENINLYEKDVISFLTSNNRQSDYEGISIVVNNIILGRVVILLDILPKKIKGILYIFYEPSDWRSNLIWWVYDFFYCDEINSKELINTFIAYNENEKGCGVRFLVDKKEEELFNNTRALKSHYLIFSKPVV